MSSFIITLLLAVTLQNFDVSAQYPPPGAMSFPGMPSISGMYPMPGMQMMPGPPGLPMSFQMPMPQRKLPVVVVPHASNDKHRSLKKKRRHRRQRRTESSSESESDSDSEDFDFRRFSKKHKQKRRQILTPVVSYVTKDGYVVYQKKIKKNKPNDWLDIGHKEKPSLRGDSQEDDDEMTVNDLKERLRQSDMG